MRIAVLITLIAALVGCGAGSSATAASETELRITVWPEGRQAGGGKSYMLRCSPAGGTLPRPGVACQKLTSLAASSAPFAAIPRTRMCTEVYGGPQQAQIVGTFRGNRVWIAISATNGCQIARAKRLSFLLPGFGTSGSA